jgi:G:T-mismatch repair DNA endonuclease (very short patch repair protein)
LGVKSAYVAVRSCATCSKQLVIRTRRRGESDRVYCSKKCYGVHLSVAYVGAANPSVDRVRSAEETAKRSGSMTSKWNDKTYRANVQAGQAAFVEQHGHWPGMDEGSFAKRRATCRVRFGVDHPWMIESIREKCEVTTLERHGKHTWQIAKEAVPTSDTRPELRFAEALRAANITHAHPFDVFYDQRRKFEYDFYLLGKRTLVEVDGDYWHAHPDKFPELDATQKWNRDHDLKKNELAGRLGLRLVRVWESDVMNEEQLTKVIEGLR